MNGSKTLIIVSAHPEIGIFYKTPISGWALTRKNLVPFIANIPPCIIGIEACGGANHWVRVFEKFGHKVHMIAPQFVKPYVKSNKNDAADAEAICEVVQCPRCVSFRQKVLNNKIYKVYIEFEAKRLQEERHKQIKFEGY